MLELAATLSKVVGGAGQWRLRRANAEKPLCREALLLCYPEGACRLEVCGINPFVLGRRDFVLITAAHDYTFFSADPLEPSRFTEAAMLGGGEVRPGAPKEPPDVLFLVGHCVLGSPDAALLISLLPRLVHVRGEARLLTLVGLMSEESRETRLRARPRSTRLLEVRLIEALRGTASPGLLRGVADPRLSAASRCMHERPGHAWTVAELTKEAAMSRSTFFDRFPRAEAPRRWFTC